MDQTMIRNLLEQYATPLYVFEERLLTERMSLLRRSLPEDVKLCFAVKANPFLGGFLTGSVDRFEICSPGEMYICEEQGLPAEKYVLSGVHKDEPSMRYAFEHGLCGGILTAESMNQFELIVSLASEYGQKVRVMPRLTNGSQFGMDEEPAILITLVQEGAHTEVTDMDAGHGKKGDAAVDAGDAPHVLVLQITAIAVFHHLKGDLVG